jgi:hypothetical protein
VAARIPRNESRDGNAGIRRTEEAGLTFRAFSTGTHADLVGACALTCWQRMDRRQHTTVDLLMERLGYRRGRAPVSAPGHERQDRFLPILALTSDRSREQVIKARSCHCLFVLSFVAPQISDE